MASTGFPTSHRNTRSSGFRRRWRSTSAPKGIGVTCLCPSGVITNVLEGITVYGTATSTPRAPAHPIVAAEYVANLTADAVEAGRFLVVTAPEVHDAL